MNLPLEHPPPDVLTDVPEVAKEENCCSVRGEPQCGHLGPSGCLPRTNFSKVFPHLRQVYSKIGIGLLQSFFCLSGAQLGPDRGRGLDAQVNRDKPGIRGSTTSQTTAMRRKTRIPSIWSYYKPFAAQFCSTDLPPACQPIQVGQLAGQSDSQILNSLWNPVCSAFANFWPEATARVSSKIFLPTSSMEALFSRMTPASMSRSA